VQTLSPQQISRAQRAADQRRDYTCRRLDVAGCPCVEVVKIKDGATYLVQLAAGLPACSCEDNWRHSDFLCKHSILALVHLRDEQQPAPAPLETEAEKHERVRADRALWD